MPYALLGQAAPTPLRPTVILFLGEGDRAHAIHPYDEGLFYFWVRGDRANAMSPYDRRLFYFWVRGDRGFVVP